MSESTLLVTPTPLAAPRLGSGEKPGLFLHFPNIKVVAVLQCHHDLHSEGLNALTVKIRQLLGMFSVAEESLYLVDSGASPKYMGTSVALCGSNFRLNSPVPTEPLRSRRLNPLVISKSFTTNVFVRMHTALIEACSDINEMRALLILAGNDIRGFAHAVNQNLSDQDNGPNNTKAGDLFVVTPGKLTYVSADGPIPPDL